MKGKTLLLAAILAWASARPAGLHAQAAGGDGEAVSGKWRETALCGLSMLLPLSMMEITTRQCTRAYIAWIE